MTNKEKTDITLNKILLAYKEEAINLEEARNSVINILSDVTSIYKKVFRKRIDQADFQMMVGGQAYFEKEKLIKLLEL